jgi:hypothetical protein
MACRSGKRGAEHFIKVECKQSTDDEGKPETSSTANTASTGVVRGDQFYALILRNSLPAGLSLNCVSQTETAMSFAWKQELKG